MSGIVNWREDILSALEDFAKVSELAGDRIVLGKEDVEFLPAPHSRPKRLPAGKAAVYGFWFNGDWLKIGTVGPRSRARYTSQHYTGSANSTLAGSLASDDNMQNVVGKINWAEWIEQNTCRVNIFLPPGQDPLQSLLEKFLHARLKPKYEK